MFDVYTTANIDTILRFLPHTLQRGCIDILHCCNDPCLRGHVAMVGRSMYIPLLPHDFANLKAWITAAVKNIDTPMLTPLWQELEYRIHECRVTRGAHLHTSNISSCQIILFQFSYGLNNSIKLGPLVFLL
jgi:hypothetical protein